MVITIEKILCTIYICLLYQCKGNFTIDTTLLKSILEAPIFQFWPLRVNFTGYSSLKVDDESVQTGIEVEGLLTKESINRIMDKVLNGENVTFVVYGGSTTRGADLGCKNNECTYHYALKYWWNYAVAPATGSYMKREVIAVGGTGSTYFGHCWKEYLARNEVIDLVIWEFFINDPDSADYGRGVEKFARSVLMYPSLPGLIFGKFFSQCPTDYETNKACNERNLLKNRVLRNLSEYYNFASINLYVSAQDYINRTYKLDMEDMFVEAHPSHLAHAQMGYLFIYYLRRYMLKNLVIRTNLQSFFKHNKDNLGYLSNRTKSLELSYRSAFPAIVLPKPLYEALDSNSICWSAVLPDDRFIMPHNLFNLPIEYKFGFHKVFKSDWQVQSALRRDVRGGYKASYKNAAIMLTFNIESFTEGNVYIALTHLLEGGNTTFNIYGQQNIQKSITVNCSRLVAKAQSVTYLGKFPSGITHLAAQTIDGGCHITALIIE